MLTRLASRRLLGGLVVFLLLLLSAHLLLPADNGLRSLVRWNWTQISHVASTPQSSAEWVFKRPKFPVKFDQDVGLLIKTGYGTQERVLAQMEALALDGTRDDIVVVGDFNATLERKKIRVEVVDVVQRMLEEDAMADMDDKPWPLEYKQLREAIDTGDETTAKHMGYDSGWHVDVLKFIPGLELAYQQAPSKKWWIIMDDDTFLIKASMERLLSHLDPSKDQYIGKAIGDYTARFGHGGSAVAISGHTLQRLMQRPELLLDAKIQSLTEVWGDKLLSSTLMKLGVYIDERFAPLFNGEPPRMTRVTAENFCIPIVSFHGLGDQYKMSTAGKIFKQIGHMVFWGQVWTMYQEPAITLFQKNPVRSGRDHVGRLDEHTTTFENVESPMDCLIKCDQESQDCLAWTWEEQTKKCHHAPWVVIGPEVPGMHTGVHLPRAQAIGDQCTEVMKTAGCFEKGSECVL